MSSTRPLPRCPPPSRSCPTASARFSPPSPATLRAVPPSFCPPHLCSPLSAPPTRSHCSPPARHPSRLSAPLPLLHPLRPHQPSPHRCCSPPQSSTTPLLGHLEARTGGDDPPSPTAPASLGLFRAPAGRSQNAGAAPCSPAWAQRRLRVDRRAFEGIGGDVDIGAVAR